MAGTLSVIDEKDRALLLEMRKLLDELLETLDVVESPEEVEAVREAEEERAVGKGRPLGELIDELRRKGEI